jgi:hypothetical protein
MVAGASLEPFVKQSARQPAFVAPQDSRRCPPPDAGAGAGLFVLPFREEGAGRLKDASQSLEWRPSGTPHSAFDPSPPALRLAPAMRGNTGTGLRRTTSRRPVVVPVGRSVGADRDGTIRKRSRRRGLPALPVNAPVDTDPRRRAAEGIVMEVLGARISFHPAQPGLRMSRQAHGIASARANLIFPETAIMVACKSGPPRSIRRSLVWRGNQKERSP